MKTNKNIIVVPAEKGKHKVLVNYIQHGIAFASEALANKHADELRNE